VAPIALSDSGPAEVPGATNLLTAAAVQALAAAAAAPKGGGPAAFPCASGLCHQSDSVSGEAIYAPQAPRACLQGESEFVSIFWRIRPNRERLRLLPELRSDP
jgi:hypothetical protein